MKFRNMSKKQLLITAIICFILSNVMFLSIASVTSDLVILLLFLLSIVFLVLTIISLIKVFKIKKFTNQKNDITFNSFNSHNETDNSKNIIMNFPEQKQTENNSNYFVNFDNIAGSSSDISNYKNNINNNPDENTQDSPCDKPILEISNDNQNNDDNECDSKDFGIDACSYTSKHTKSSKEIQKTLIEKFNIGPTLYKLQYSYDRIPIVGSKYIEGIEEIIKNLNSNSLIILKNEIDNEYDKNAVGVYNMENGKEIIIGYLKKDSHCYTMFNDYMNKDGKALAVLDISGELLLKIGFYLPTEIESLKSIVFTPNSIYNDEVQETLELCDIDEDCYVDYDFDKDKDVLCCDYGEIGNIPKKISDIISTSSEYYLFIKSLETVEKDYEDKIKPKIILYYE